LYIIVHFLLEEFENFSKVILKYTIIVTQEVRVGVGVWFWARSRSRSPTKTRTHHPWSIGTVLLTLSDLLGLAYMTVATLSSTYRSHSSNFCDKSVCWTSRGFSPTSELLVTTYI